MAFWDTGRCTAVQYMQLAMVCLLLLPPLPPPALLPASLPTMCFTGTQVLRVWKAKQSIFFKRSMAVGYAGLDNPVFYKDNNRMLLGDAKEVLDQLRSVV
jgi:hypothetical protein